MPSELEHGDLVEDRDDPKPNPAVVVNTPRVSAEEWYVGGRGTVAMDNPDYPADAPVVVVVYQDDLREVRPYYCGTSPLKLAALERETRIYAFPAPRLERVGSLGLPTVPLDRIQPSPYHARNFDVDANREFIAEIRERGHPEPVPFARALDGAVELVNGHKRVWASHVAGLEEIPVRSIYADREHAARMWAERHLDGYSGDEVETALDRLRADWGDQATDIAESVVCPDGGDEGA